MIYVKAERLADKRRVADERGEPELDVIDALSLGQIRGAQTSELRNPMRELPRGPDERAERVKRLSTAELDGPHLDNLRAFRPVQQLKIECDQRGVVQATPFTMDDR